MQISGWMATPAAVSRAHEFQAQADEPMHLLRIGGALPYYAIVGIAIYRMSVIDQLPITQSTVLEFLESTGLVIGDSPSEHGVWACLQTIKLNSELGYLANVVDEEGRCAYAYLGKRKEPLFKLTDAGMKEFGKLYQDLAASEPSDYLP